MELNAREEEAVRKILMVMQKDEKFLTKVKALKDAKKYLEVLHDSEGVEGTRVF